MTTPNIAPPEYSKDSRDYNIAKVDRTGAVRMQSKTVTVPASTASGQVIGLIPFNKGFRFSVGASQLYVGDLDTGSDVTMDVGYIYDDDTTYTNDPNAFASALTTAQTGGLITFDEHAGLTWEAEADGWIAVTLGGGQPTTTEGVIKGQLVHTYDGA